jgi:hypothetical protein
MTRVLLPRFAVVRFGSSLMFAMLCLTGKTALADPPAGSWLLTGSDEFDSGSTPQYPNSTNWGYESGYVCGDEWQYYTNTLENAYCQDGILHIVARKFAPGTFPPGSFTNQAGSISSASLTSNDKVAFQYGWLEMRVRIDTRLGGTNGFSGNWSMCVSSNLTNWSVLTSKTIPCSPSGTNIWVHTNGISTANTLFYPPCVEYT